jgi:BirA family biotin operon repressor/biotin-[acetyl-CoA-carboxylase] ligase
VAGFALGPAAAAAGYGLLEFDAIASTSGEARAQARAGARGPLWITAREQSAGYGRRGRTWHSPAGNLAASLLMTVEGGPARAATLGFVAGIALSAALDTMAPALAGRITLKWPNDMLADGAKIAGILVEAEELADGRLAAIVGIGLNVAAAPDDLPYAATSLKALGASVTAEALLYELTEAWVAPARQWAQEGGFAHLREAWLARAAGLGAAAAVRRGGNVIRGTFETIDGDGRLILCGPDGVRHAIAAGEVHFGAAATATAG